jgi:hypothetical protein
MAEDLLKKYTFAVDSIKATNGKPVTIAFSQGDVKTAILIINLTENDTALDLTGKKVRVSFKKSDGTSVMQDMTTGISFLDAAAGKIQIQLSTQALSARGNVRGQISITDEVAGLVAETAEFTFVVRESIVNTSIISTDELPIIEQTIEAAKVLESVDLQTIVNNTSNVNSLKSEVETARGASANLAGRFSSVESSLAQSMSQINDSASIPRYTFNPTQNYDVLLTQMREEIAKTRKIVVTRDLSGATYFDAIRKINSAGGNVTIRMEAEVNGNVTAVFKKADTVTFSGLSGDLGFTNIGTGVWEKTFSPADSTKYFINIGLSIASTEPSTTYARITKLSMVQDGVELIGDLMRRLSGATGFVGATQITTDYGYRYNLKNNGVVLAPKVIYVSHTGIASGLGESATNAITWDYFADTVYPVLKTNTSFVVLESGTYRIANRTQLLKIASADKVTFVCPNGKALFDCGEEKATSVWTQVSGSDFISVPYDPVNHWNTSVKDGTVAPMITYLESGTKTRLKLTKVNSQTDCQNTDGSYYYDFTNKKFYINWANGVSYYISVPELQSGFRIENKDAVINFINIEVRSAESSAFFVIPTAKGSGKISWYNCVAGSSGTGEDFKIQYIDTDMVNCRSVMAGNDGFNFHYEGKSNIVNCEAWGAFNDGMSHHENTKGFVWNYRALYCGTSASTPAYGAEVYHESCYSEGNGFDNIRGYSGGFAVLGGSGYAETKAIYVNCESVNDERGFAGSVSSDSGGNLGIIIAHNCKVTTPTNQAYVTATAGVKINSIAAKGDKTTSGDSITFVA